MEGTSPSSPKYQISSLYFQKEKSVLSKLQLGILSFKASPKISPDSFFPFLPAVVLSYNSQGTNPSCWPSYPLLLVRATSLLFFITPCSFKITLSLILCPLLYWWCPKKRRKLTKLRPRRRGPKLCHFLWHCANTFISSCIAKAQFKFL